MYAFVPVILITGFELWNGKGYDNHLTVLKHFTDVQNYFQNEGHLNINVF